MESTAEHTLAKLLIEIGSIAKDNERFYTSANSDCNYYKTQLDERNKTVESLKNERAALQQRLDTAVKSHLDTMGKHATEFAKLHTQICNLQRKGGKKRI